VTPAPATSVLIGSARGGGTTPGQGAVSVEATLASGADRTSDLGPRTSARAT